MATYTLRAFFSDGTVADEVTVDANGPGAIGTINGLNFHLPVADDYTFAAVTPETAPYEVIHAIQDDTAPTISGVAKDGFTVTITEGTYTGTAPITVTGTLTLDGVDVTANMVGSDYTIPAGSVGKVLEWKERASNVDGVSRQQTASLTGGGVFSFADYFTAGQEGAAFDISDLSTLAANADGTGAITTDGESVKYVGDLSGRGNHLTITDVGKAPLYRTDGTYHWLEFDGVSDYLATPSKRWAQPRGYFCAMAAEVPDASVTTFLMAADTDTNRVAQFLKMQTGNLQTVSIGGNVVSDTTPGPASNTPFVAEATCTNIAIETIVNGASDGSTFAENLSTDSVPLRVFGYQRGGTVFPGKFFGGILRDEPPSEAEQLEAREFLAFKSGAVLV